MKRHSAILSNLLLSLPLATGLLCVTANASAQTSALPSESATIPFAFSAGHQQLPAGSYEVQRLSDCLLSLRNLQAEKTEIFMVRAAGGGNLETRGRLVFQRDGTGNYLTQVRIAGKSSYSELIVKPEPGQAVAKNIPPGSSFEIALK
jgi:hypothetical protein